MSELFDSRKLISGTNPAIEGRRPYCGCAPQQPVVYLHKSECPGWRRKPKLKSMGEWVRFPLSRLEVPVEYWARIRNGRPS